MTAWKCRNEHVVTQIRVISNVELGFRVEDHLLFELESVKRQTTLKTRMLPAQN